MAQFTPNYGLSFFGGGSPGSILDDGSKFTREDPKTVDALIKALATHNHTGGEAVPDPTGTPALLLSTDDGLIPSGKTYYYQISFVDQYGLESRAGNEVSISTPPPLAEAAAPTVFTSAGGSLSVNTIYYYAVTVIAGDTETGLSPATFVQIGETDRTVTVFLPSMPVGGEEFRIWRRAAGESSYTQLGTSASETYLDDGVIPSDPCACEPDMLPPDGNFTNSTNSITLTLDTSDAEIVQGEDFVIRGWRIYRSEVSGTYSGTSLVAEVVETEATDDGESGPIVVVFTDEGNALLPGQPRKVSQTFAPPPLLGDVKASGGSGSGALQMLGEGDAGWAVSCDFEGSLVTYASGALPLPEGFLFLTDEDNTLWRVSLDATGVLVTDNTSTATRKDTKYTVAGEGPLLGTPDATFAYQLSIDSAGVLITTPVGQRAPVVASSTVGSGAPVGTANNGDTYFDRLDSFAIWVFDEVWHKVGEPASTDDVTVNSVESDDTTDTVTVTWSEA